MTIVIVFLAALALANGAAAAEPAPECEVPQSLIPAETDLTHVATEIQNRHRLDITVVGSGSSVLSGPDGPRFAYPAQLEEALKQRLPGEHFVVDLFEMMETAAHREP